jgi:TIR domain
MSKIFISYNRQSEVTTKSLVGDLESMGHVVWFDQELSGGQAWWDQILARVRDCEVFVFVLDTKSLDSTACRREFGYAADLGKPVLPVLVAEGVSANLLPPELSRLQFVDYRKLDRNAAFSLARALANIPPSKPLPDPLPPQPEVPVSYLGNLTRKIDSASTLTYEEQSALMVDLRRSLRDPEATADTRTLLDRFRSRRDLLAAIADEIDELRGSPGRAQSNPAPSRPAAPKAAPSVELPQEMITGPPPVMSVTRWGRGAFIGGAAGAVIGAIAGGLSHHPSDWLVAAFFVGTGGMFAGAIIGADRTVAAIASVGGVLGIGLGALMNSESVDPLVSAILYGLPPGVILGAIVGAILKRIGWA